MEGRQRQQGAREGWLLVRGCLEQPRLVVWGLHEGGERLTWQARQATRQAALISQRSR